MKFKVKRTSDWYTYRRKKNPPKGCFKEKDYFVSNFNTIEDLLDFVNQEGDIILLSDKEDNLPVLEIYDECREQQDTLLIRKE